MAKYIASPEYSVNVKERKPIAFDRAGTYETDDTAEIAILEALCPLWITREDEAQPEVAAEKVPRTRKAALASE